MFMQILWTQFRWTRGILASTAVLAFVAPALAWRLGEAGSTGVPGALAVMMGLRFVGPIIAMTAILLGFMLVVHTWNVDGAAKHVYALSLPIAWQRYVAMRFGAGALTLLVPTLALWLGSLLALALIEMPATLNAYPGTLALRFLLGSLLAYSLTFLLQYVAGRRAPVALLSILLVGMIVMLVISVFGYSRILLMLGNLLTEWPGPLAVFANEWKLVDV